MFKPVSVQISNCYDFPLERHPFTIGVPWPEGAFTRQQHLQLICNGQPRQFNATPLAHWPDRSIKWLLLDFQASMEANEQLLCQLASDEATENPSYQQSE